MPLPPLPTRQSLGIKEDQARAAQPSATHSYGMFSGVPAHSENGTTIRHDVSTPEGVAKFHAHMDRLGTPEAQAMKAAHATGHVWDVPAHSFSEFAKYDPHTLADFAAASPGAHIKFFTTSSGNGKFGLEMKAPDGSYSLRRVDPQGKEVINDSLKAPNNLKGKGWGARALLQQVQAARKLGITHLRMDTAAGKPGSTSVHNGYYTWPRLGWDGSLENTAGHELPQHLAHIKTFHELFDHPEGPGAWRDAGNEAYGLHFDTRPGSPHVQRLVKYLRGVQAQRRAQG